MFIRRFSGKQPLWRTHKRSAKLLFTIFLADSMWSSQEDYHKYHRQIWIVFALLMVTIYRRADIVYTWRHWINSHSTWHRSSLQCHSSGPSMMGHHRIGIYAAKVNALPTRLKRLFRWPNQKTEARESFCISTEWSQRREKVNYNTLQTRDIIY